MWLHQTHVAPGATLELLALGNIAIYFSHDVCI